MHSWKIFQVLLGNPELLRKKAQVLDLALGSGIYVKQPMLFGINAKNVAKRVANLKVVVGEALSVEELLVKKPNILIASEETAREMWLKLVNMFGKDDVVRSIRGLHHILGRNWKGLHPKLDYLKSKGFSRGDLLTCLSNIAFASLDVRIKPRVEMALQECRQAALG